MSKTPILTGLLILVIALLESTIGFSETHEWKASKDPAETGLWKSPKDMTDDELFETILDVVPGTEMLGDVEPEEDEAKALLAEFERRGLSYYEEPELPKSKTGSISFKQRNIKAFELFRVDGKFVRRSNREELRMLPGEHRIKIKNRTMPPAMLWEATFTVEKGHKYVIHPGWESFLRTYQGMGELKVGRDPHPYIVDKTAKREVCEMK